MRQSTTTLASLKNLSRAHAIKNHNIISNARCEQITLKPRDENDPDYLESIKISAPDSVRKTLYKIR